jgi:TIR domain
MTDGLAGIFISYRQEDSRPWAVLLCEELSDAFGEDRVFLDLDTLHSGSWREQIEVALNQSRVVLVVIGRRWLTITDEAGVRRLNRSDDVHRQEIALALARKGMTVIPVRVDGAAMPYAEDLPTDIRTLCEQQSRELSDSRARRGVDMRLLFRDIERITGIEAKRKKLPYSEALKEALVTTLVIIASSLLVWLFFYLVSPEAPLTLAETTVVVGMCLAVVLSVKWVWARLRRTQGRDVRAYLGIFFLVLASCCLIHLLPGAFRSSGQEQISSCSKSESASL